MTQLEARRPGLRVRMGASRRPALAAVCTRCGGEEVSALRSNCPPDAAATYFRGRGWVMRGDAKSAICPKCQIRNTPTEQNEVEVTAALERQQRREEQRQRAAQELSPMKQTTPSPDALRAQRRLHELLGVHFDGGTYAEAWSDERVARETGLAVAEVARVRDAAYGPLVDPRLATLTAEVGRVRGELGQGLATLGGMLDEIRAQYEGRLADLERRLAEVRA